MQTVYVALEIPMRCLIGCGRLVNFLRFTWTLIGEGRLLNKILTVFILLQ